MNWKWDLVLVTALLNMACVLCACKEAPVDTKSEVTVESVFTLSHEEEEPTTMPPSIAEEDLYEQIAANISGIGATADPPVEFVNFASDTFLKDCKCGRQGEPADFPFKTRYVDYEGEALVPDKFVIGGEATGEYEFKWMVGIAKKRIFDPPGKPPRLICGATLINSKFLLTAAHCIDKEAPYNFHILFKTHNLTEVFVKKSSVMVVTAKRFIPHPRWNVSTVANDIGLIELQEPIDFANEPNIRPACLPTPFDGDFAGQQATATGWGYTVPRGAMATVLQKVTVPVISHNDCVKTKYSTMVTTSMVCAGYPEGGKDACTNDSGGPLTVSTPEGYHKVIGVTSWGHGCAQPNAPGVYTRVTKYLNWIRSVVKGSEWCTPN